MDDRFGKYRTEISAPAYHALRTTAHLGRYRQHTLSAITQLLAGVLKPVERFYEPLISLIYPVPKVAILPLIFAWFGLGSLSKIVVMTISIFFPTYIAAFYGAKSVNRVHLWSGRLGGARV